MTQHDDPYASHGTTPSSPVALEAVRITLELYRTGKSGIQYGKLQEFIQPILKHYEIELDTGFTDDVTPGNLEDMTLLLDIFETATMFWEYCCLDAPAKLGAFHNLKESLLGPHPPQEDLAQFPVLVASMEEQWTHLSKGEPMPGSYPATPNEVSPQVAPPPFSENGASHYGPEKMDIPDAFALFSRPLLDNDAIYEDPESFDDVMTKAQAYWDLAHLAAAERDLQIDSIISKFCTATSPREQINKEALLMIQRFHELFPERK